MAVHFSQGYLEKCPGKIQKYSIKEEGNNGFQNLIAQTVLRISPFHKRKPFSRTDFTTGNKIIDKKDKDGIGHKIDENYKRLS